MCLLYLCALLTVSEFTLSDTDTSSTLPDAKTCTSTYFNCL